MSAPIPADLASEWYIAKQFPLEHRFSDLRVQQLIERIAALEAHNRQLREALEVIRAKAAKEYPVSIGNQNAWAYVEDVAEAALAATEETRRGEEPKL